MSYCWIDGARYEWFYVHEWFWTQIAIAALLAWMTRHGGIRTDFDWCRLP